MIRDVGRKSAAHSASIYRKLDCGVDSVLRWDADLWGKAECAALFRPTIAAARSAVPLPTPALLPATHRLRYVIALPRTIELPPSIEDDLATTPRITALLRSQLRVINIGLPVFAEELQAAEIPVVQLDWRPPVADPRIRALLAKLS